MAFPLVGQVLLNEFIYPSNILGHQGPPVANGGEEPNHFNFVHVPTAMILMRPWNHR